jgi:hypothetical protein
MLMNAVWLFALAALVGAFMAVLHFRGRTPPPVAAAVLHGVFAVSAVVPLLMGVMEAGWGTVQAKALGVFVVAALGGLYLVSHHFRGKALPGPVVVIHGLVAVIGFLMLVVAVFAIG